MTIIDPFLLTPLLAGLAIALLSAPIGCLIAWQRLVYFGDTVAHASLLGIVLALVFSTAPLAGMLLVAVLVALAVTRFADDALLPPDSLLGIVAHASLALALVIVSKSPSITIDINGLLFGDILATNAHDVATLIAAALVSAAIIAYQWKPLMRFILHPDIAAVEGVNPKRMRLLIMLLIALMVALSIKLVGILLITSLLILPAACARLLARSPGQMMVLACAASMVAVGMGFAASVAADTPTGPSIILSALILLAFLGIARRFTA